MTTTTSLRIERLSGARLDAALGDLAHLRGAVFREFPYLYAVDEAYEREYLSSYAAADGAVLVAAFDGDRLVGAATGAPMEAHKDAFAEACRAHGFPPEQMFYCGESVLLSQYRGQGVGHIFFDLREAQARVLGRRTCGFCAVVRPADHPLRPAGYTPLDGFWTKRGYRLIPGLTAQFSWPDIDGDGQSTEKTMQFWMRDLV